MESLEARYLFKGWIVLNTALHIGGGRETLVYSDAPVVRTPDGRPYIPGSSFKGVFRSTVEKLAGSIPGLRICFLDQLVDCVGPQGERQKCFNQQRNAGNWNDRELVQRLETGLCDSCRLFGSPYMASKAVFSDLYLEQGENAFMQIRDGVGIDRDSECAVDRIKYDYEVVAADVRFQMQIILENPTEKQLGLISVGLMEFVSGMVGVGGKRSRGLGNCRLDDLQIYFVDWRDDANGFHNLKRYLLGSRLEEKMEPVPDVQDFLRTKIEALLKESEACAEAVGK